MSPAKPARSSELRRNTALSDSEIDAIAERLRAGETLDERYRPLLFSQAKEATLSYAGKESRGSILAQTMAVPLQTVKSFGPSRGWSNKLVFGDNLQMLKTLLELKDRGGLTNADGSRGVRLCYIDPPFATKREFRGNKGQLAYRDKVEGAEFIEFLRKRLVLIHELLADGGALFLHLDTNKVHYMKVVLDEIFGPSNFHTEIVWKRSSAHSDTKQGRAQHGRIHDTILFYTKGPDWVWNPIYTPYDDEHVDSSYKHIEQGTGRRYFLGDITGPGGASKGNPRYTVFGITRYWRFSRKEMQRLIDEGIVVQPSPGAVPRQKRYLDEMPGVPLQDVWTDVKPIGAQAAEREGYPTQKPLELLERIIASSTNEDDLVLDCFAGSGTTAVAAERLGRRWVTVDCGKLAVYTAQRRLLSVSDGNGKKRKRRQAAPFELCHAGLYDNELLEQLPAGSFTDFALALFGCVKRHQTIAGIEFAGTRGGGPVHIFPFDRTEAEMGLDYIESLHERIGDKVSGAVYVVVPVLHCDPGLFENVIVRDRATYFIMRVPYSVIEALHDRDFKLIGQPVSRDELNDALDSFGFDFMELPEVNVDWECKNASLTGAIKEFRRGGLDPDDFGELEDKGRGSLAMVMVDRHWDGNAFRVEDYLFGEDLRNAKWKMRLDLENAGDRLLVIFMDTHGNELRQVIEPAKLSRRRKATAARTTRSPKKATSSRSASRPAKAATKTMARPAKGVARAAAKVSRTTRASK